MEYKDYYKILGLERGAGDADIKRAYRKLARKYHPDVSKEANAEARFKEVGEAYEVLKDPEKRAAYDQLGANWQAGQEFRPPPGWQPASQNKHFYTRDFTGFTGADTDAFSDFFEALFGSDFYRQGRSRQSEAQTRGQDLRTKMTVSLEEAANGGEHLLKLQIPTATLDGQMVNQQKSVRIKIPQGVTQGQQIRLKGQGAPGRAGGAKGDLYIEINIAKHPLFSLDGRDLHVNLPITPWEAALGASIVLPTLKGKIGIKIPAGSQSGKRLRLKGKGLPGKVPGDLYAQLQIITPKADTEQAKQFYERMAKEMPLDPRAQMVG